MNTTPFPFQALEDCTRNAGSAAFADSFSSLLEEDLGVEQCLLFVLPDNRTDDFSALRCLLSLNFGRGEGAPALASAYLGGRLQQDANLALLETAPAGHWQVLPFRELTLPGEENGRRYDRISLIRRDGRMLYYFILYCRNDGSGVGGSNLPSMAGSMLLSHIRHADPALIIDPVSFLPEAERNYCAALLRAAKGKTPDEVMHGEDPRWRESCRKLGIRKVEDLVSLCR